MLRRILFILVFVCIGSAPAFSKKTSYDLGPVFGKYEDVHGEIHTKAVGPFFETVASTQGMSFVAFRPFYSKLKDPVNDRKVLEVLWPLTVSREIKDESLWRVLIFFGFNHDTEKTKHRNRLWLFPFYFQGVDKEGVKYKALFPIGGSIHEFLGRDEISFALFPIRSKSKLNDLKTSNWLWPLISETKGTNIYRARAFPFYGVSELKGKYKKKFVLWPIWNSVEYKYPGSSGKGYILFPLWGRVNLEDQKTLWVIPPLFRFTKGDKLNVTYCPWPFFQKTSGRVNKLYIWPLWGHKERGGMKQTFVLWPFFWNENFDQHDELRHRFMFVPFVFTETVTDKTPQRKVLKKYRKVWPLFSYRKVGDERRFRTLELWPFPETPPVERNWAPFWTIYCKTKNGKDTDTELLWGLYRSHHREKGVTSRSLFPIYHGEYKKGKKGKRSWSILGGLVGYERKDSHKRLKLLYLLNFGGKKEKSP